MALTVATWNINSVRLRAGLVERLLVEAAPDVLCLQETKCPVAQFPGARFAALGYAHQVVRGQKGYNGVAILSRLPLVDAGHHDFCGRGDARHVAARLPGDVTIHNLYLPAGGDVPDPEANPKFRHKLSVLEALKDWLRAAPGQGMLVMGDLNVAPLPDDVWSHRQMLKVVSHTPVETAALEAARAAGGLVDLPRLHQPDGKLYSWWSYRARDWAASDRGRRLDHVWASPDLADRSVASETLRAARGWEGPSDHVPVLVTFRD